MADEALVMNSGDVPVTLRLYAADATTAINGGTGVASDGEEKNGVARWLSLPMSELSLQPGETKVVPFLITVPSDALPGQHVAGLVLEAVTDNPDSAAGSVRRSLW
jgi:dihydroorotate dehydrogenase (fumarate)